MSEALPGRLAGPGTRNRSVDIFAFVARYGTLIALVLLILFNLAYTRNFATLQTLNVNLTQVCTIVIVATGMTLVIATRGIDLSVGSMMAIAGALAPLIFLNPVFGSNVALAVSVAMVAAIFVATLCGLFNGWLVAQFNIQPIVATLVLFIAGRGIAQAM